MRNVFHQRALLLGPAAIGTNRRSNWLVSLICFLCASYFKLGIILFFQRNHDNLLYNQYRKKKNFYSHNSIVLAQSASLLCVLQLFCDSFTAKWEANLDPFDHVPYGAVSNRKLYSNIS